MDFKFSKQTEYKDFGNMQLGISPYCIFDQKDKVLYLPDLSMFENLADSAYQKAIEEQVLMNSMDRYNTLLMSGLNFNKASKMKLGTYKLSPLRFSNEKVNIEDYYSYFITDEK